MYWREDNASRVLVGTNGVQRPSKRPTRKWDGHIKMDLKRERDVA
jgi:hypothetical protein